MQSTQYQQQQRDGGQASNAAPLNSRLAAKQAELEGLKQLRDYSAKLVKELEKMGDGLQDVQRSGQSVAQVMSTWQTVFRGIQVAQSSVAAQTEGVAEHGDGDGEAEAERLASVTPDTLVRIPVNRSHGHQSGSTEGSD
ncbi:unnamed protein product [Sympodiomycopsis kandeliae]